MSQTPKKISECESLPDQQGLNLNVQMTMIQTHPEGDQQVLTKSDSGFSEKAAMIEADSTFDELQDDSDQDEDEVDDASGSAVHKRPELSLEKAKFLFDKKLASLVQDEDDEEHLIMDHEDHEEDGKKQD